MEIKKQYIAIDSAIRMYKQSSAASNIRILKKGSSSSFEAIPGRRASYKAGGSVSPPRAPGRLSVIAEADFYTQSTAVDENSVRAYNGPSKALTTGASQPRLTRLTSSEFREQRDLMDMAKPRSVVRANSILRIPEMDVR